MKILKLFTNWLNKTGEESKKTKKARQDFEWMKIERKERIAREAAKRALNNMKIKDYTVGHLPGSMNTKFSSLSSKNLQTTISSAVVNNNVKSTIHIDGENNRVSINSPLEINGRDILKELDEMRDALLLLKRAVDMEAKYPKLRKLKDEYEQALEKYKTFEALK
jgi:hypothetical protein